MNSDPEQVMKEAANLGFSFFAHQAISEARQHVQRYGMASLQAHMEKKLHEWRHVKVKLAITGQSGAGR